MLAQEVYMPLANAPVFELGQLRLARFHVESGSTVRLNAERFQVPKTRGLRLPHRHRAGQQTAPRLDRHSSEGPYGL